MGLPPRMQTIVLINAAAGTVVSSGGSLDRASLDAAFHGAGLHPEIHYVKPEEFSRRVGEAVARRPDCLVIGGGDGTLNSAVSLMVEPGITLGILPFGTLNHFAGDLKIPDALEEAVAVIAHGFSRAIDLGEVNGRIFLNNFSIGAYPEAVRQREHLRSRHGQAKWTAMTVASWNVLKRLRRFRAEVEIDGRTERVRSPFILVSNNHYAGHVFSRRLREKLDAGELWVYWTRAYRLLAVCHLGLRALFGQLESAEAFSSQRAGTLGIKLPGQSVEGAMDGELAQFELPLRLRSRPGALRVMVPPEPAA